MLRLLLHTNVTIYKKTKYSFIVAELHVLLFSTYICVNENKHYVSPRINGHVWAILDPPMSVRVLSHLTKTMLFFCRQVWTVSLVTMQPCMQPFLFVVRNGCSTYSWWQRYWSKCVVIVKCERALSVIQYETTTTTRRIQCDRFLLEEVATSRSFAGYFYDFNIIK